MRPLTAKLIRSYRAETFRWLPALRLKSKEQAVDFVNERGFVYFWPITGIALPSLWDAAAGHRPVSDRRDDPGHVTWGWKDSLLGEGRCYYAKVLRKKATLIALGAAPYFYALSENYGAPEEDYLTQYQQGRLTQEAKAVYEAVLREGKLDTVALRKAARLAGDESAYRFGRALDELQADFKILPVGVAEVGAWRYAFIYDLATRRYPDLADRARPIGRRVARRKLAELYFSSMGAAQLSDVTKLFGWRTADANGAVDDLSAAGIVRRGLSLKGRPGEWVAVAALT